MTPRRAGLLVALFASALALRPQIVGVGPVLPQIQDELDTSHALIGLLGTIPVLCMGLFAPPAPLVSRRLGTRLAIGACIGLIGIAGVARAFAPGAVALVLLTFPIGIGIGLAGAIMPVAVKERMAHRPAFGTGVYATGIQVGSTVAAATAVPLAAVFGGWRGALAAFSVATIGLAAVWLAQTRREPAHEPAPFRPPKLPLRSPIAWTLVAVFALLATGYYGLNSWLPDSYAERGWSEGSAGALLAVYNLCSIPGGLVVSWVADRHGSRRLYMTGAAALFALSVVGILLVPGAGFLWVALIGASNGVLFTLVMTLPLDVSRTPAGVGAVAGLMLGAGYTLGALAPLVLGAARDLTGSFTSSLWLVVGTSAALTALCVTLTPRRLHRGVDVGEPAPTGR